MPYQNKPYLLLAKGKPCVICGSLDGVVACHYSGKYASQLGKGMGNKVHDFCVAHLCHKCHTEMDSYESGNDDERAVKFMIAIFKTLNVCLETEELEMTIGMSNM